MADPQNPPAQAFTKGHTKGYSFQIEGRADTNNGQRVLAAIRYERRQLDENFSKMRKFFQVRVQEFRDANDIQRYRATFFTDANKEETTGALARLSKTLFPNGPDSLGGVSIDDASKIKERRLVHYSTNLENKPALASLRAAQHRDGIVVSRDPSSGKTDVYALPTVKNGNRPGGMTEAARDRVEGIMAAGYERDEDNRKRVEAVREREENRQYVKQQTGQIRTVEKRTKKEERESRDAVRQGEKFKKVIAALLDKGQRNLAKEQKEAERSFARQEKVEAREQKVQEQAIAKQEKEKERKARVTYAQIRKEAAAKVARQRKAGTNAARFLAGMSRGVAGGGGGRPPGGGVWGGARGGMNGAITAGRAMLPPWLQIVTELIRAGWNIAKSILSAVLKIGDSVQRSEDEAATYNMQGEDVRELNTMAEVMGGGAKDLFSKLLGQLNNRLHNPQFADGLIKLIETLEPTLAAGGHDMVQDALKLYMGNGSPAELATNVLNKTFDMFVHNKGSLGQEMELGEALRDQVALLRDTGIESWATILEQMGQKYLDSTDKQSEVKRRAAENGGNYLLAIRDVLYGGKMPDAAAKVADPNDNLTAGEILDRFNTLVVSMGKLWDGIKTQILASVGFIQSGAEAFFRWILGFQFIRDLIPGAAEVAHQWDVQTHEENVNANEINETLITNYTKILDEIATSAGTTKEDFAKQWEKFSHSGQQEDLAGAFATDPYGIMRATAFRSVQIDYENSLKKRAEFAREAENYRNGEAVHPVKNASNNQRSHDVKTQLWDELKGLARIIDEAADQYEAAHNDEAVIGNEMEIGRQTKLFLRDTDVNGALYAGDPFKGKKGFRDMTDREVGLALVNDPALVEVLKARGHNMTGFIETRARLLEEADEKADLLARYGVTGDALGSFAGDRRRAELMSSGMENGEYLRAFVDELQDFTEALANPEARYEINAVPGNTDLNLSITFRGETRSEELKNLPNGDSSQVTWMLGGGYNAAVKDYEQAVGFSQ